MAFQTELRRDERLPGILRVARFPTGGDALNYAEAGLGNLMPSQRGNDGE